MKLKKAFRIGLLIAAALVLLAGLFYHKVFFVRNLSEEEAERYRKYDMMLSGGKQEILKLCGYEEEPEDLRIDPEEMSPLKEYLPMCAELIEGSIYEPGGALSVRYRAEDGAEVWLEYREAYGGKVVYDFPNDQVYSENVRDRLYQLCYNVEDGARTGHIIIFP